MHLSHRRRAGNGNISSASAFDRRSAHLIENGYVRKKKRIRISVLLQLGGFNKRRCTIDFRNVSKLNFLRSHHDEIKT